MDTDNNNKASLIPNIITAIIFIILAVPFSSAYFSYALIIFVLFTLWDLYVAKKHGTYHFPSLSSFRVPAFSILLFYSAIILTAVVNWDIPSMKEGLAEFYLSLPCFMLWYAGCRHNIKAGVKSGLVIGITITCLYALNQLRLHPDTRIVGLFAHPNHLGTMMNLVLPFFLYYFAKSSRITERLLFALTTFIGFLCLYLSGSRGALAAFIISLMISIFITFILFHKTLLFKRYFIPLFITLMSIAIASGALYNLQKSRIDAWNESGGERLLMYNASYEMWVDNPITGVGLANWKENYYSPKYHPMAGKEKNLDMPHNMFLYFLSTAGIIGAISYIFYIITTFLSLCKKAISFPSHPWLFTVILISFFSFLIHGMVDTTIINKIPARMYFALIGYIFSLKITLSDNDL